jgi:hypothetical protein
MEKRKIEEGGTPPLPKKFLPLVGDKGSFHPNFFMVVLNYLQNRGDLSFYEIKK